MYFVGIDISKYKHDCFITTETGTVIIPNLSFQNNQDGFQKLLNLLNSLDNEQKIRIGFEATGHYHLNLMLFLEKNNFSFMEFNPALVKKFISTTTLRRTKTDKKDAISITQYLMSVDYKPYPKQFYHKYALKSLTRRRSAFVHQRSYYKVQLTNILDVVFPEFKPFFSNSFSSTALFILLKYPSSKKIANMKDYESIRKHSRGKFVYSKFFKLKDLAKNTVGVDNEIFTFQLSSMLTLLSNMDEQISLTEDKIAQIIKELNPRCLSINGVGLVSCASIVAEYGDFNRFKSPDACLAFAGLEPSTIQSGQVSHNGKMVKHGSSHLRATLMRAAEYVFIHEPVFTTYYYKKRGEGKPHRVAISHLAKKLVRVIYTLETNDIPFDSLKLR
jgi:Transposase and inactivated derivatives